MKFVLLLLALLSTESFAQGAWAYVELPHSSTSVKAGDRWDAGTVKWEGGENGFSFVIPPDLVAGKEIRIDLQPAEANGTDAPFQTLAGPHGDAVCTRDGVARTCLIRLRDLGVTVEEGTAYLDQKYGAGRDKHRKASHHMEEFLESSVLRFWHGHE